ncbi:hypothetical protein M422DRAFT_28548 [Sphaerobolus stellatus SS14]|uniref:Sulfotransferase family protein n=1 Tax=Sphaerobolus stellatus (strain SS14) TaxID=990650 RepID=A0A0C9VWC1_SPHS4|nr:hypothetical protein M422DRAFT_28548 [Sphaerobolus stellatus SS14]
MTANEKLSKIIGLGLGRTGTTSLQTAFESLGLQPVYHMSTIIERNAIDELDQWRKIGLEGGTEDDIRKLLDSYPVVLDYPPAMYPELLYKTYPDAKFILTVRDPSKWSQSVKNTIMKAIEEAKKAAPSISPPLKAALEFGDETINGWYHSGRMFTHGEEEFLKHIERVKRAVPADKLLIYDVREGWDRLADFIGIEKPAQPFPHVNDTAQYQENVLKSIGK